MKNRSLQAAWSLVFLTLLPGCRFGSLGGSATDLLDVDTGALPDDSADAEDPGELPSDDEQAWAGDGDGDGGDGDEGQTPDGSDACAAQTMVPGCDPVAGVGCTAGINQCVVDPDAAMAAGRCVFPSAALAMGCDENVLYTTCPTGFTCKQGECRKYCYCDTDCDQGDTCSEPAGQGTSDVFSLCLNTRP